MDRGRGVDGARWRKVEQVYHSAAPLSPVDRQAFLETACAGDAELRAEVESLLSQSTSKIPDRAGLETSLLGPYEILEAIGKGGMGVVYKARDTRLDRTVAIKVSAAEFGARFEREARAAAALNHPHVCSIFDVGPNYLVMEYLEGASLADRLKRGRMAASEIVSVAAQILDALDAAHAAGIIHRDIKPANLWITARGDAKILDFGLAKRSPMAADSGLAGAFDEATVTMATALTRPGTVVGTMAYMSPEQALGGEVDARSDLFSLGAVLYEMATGRRPFQGATPSATLLAIAHENPASVSKMNPDIPGDLSRVISRCLEKTAGDRYRTAREALEDLRPLAFRGTARRTRWLWTVGLAVLLLALTAAYAVARRNANIRWAREQALPQIMQATQHADYFAAFALAQRAQQYIPDDAILRGLWPHFSRVVTVESTPTQADVYREPYQAGGQQWQYLGKTPLRQLRVAHGYSRWKLVKAGYVTLEAGGELPEMRIPPQPEQTMRFTLFKEDDPAASMVRVEGAATLIQVPGLEGFPTVELPAYLLDRYEVSNREFQKFVEDGGYEKPQYWKQPFLREGRALTWQDAMKSFRDRTGRPGPAGWELSDYPAGQDDYPVVGVSWFESAAYAEYVHKRLPTAYHWSRAALPFSSGWVVPLSNFSGAGLMPRQASRAVSPWGVYDLAGNAKEWCWNESGNGRLILGGGYNEPPYMFNDWDSKSPWERQPNFGFRLMQPAEQPVPAAAEVPVPTSSRDYRKEKPVSDAVFRIYRSLYSYDRVPLNGSTDLVQQTEDWRAEKIAFHAGYGDERLTGFLITPKRTGPPYQVVVNFPGAQNLHTRAPLSLEDSLEFHRLEYLLKSGRALVLLTLKGTHDRSDALRGDHPDTSALYRDHVIMWSKELCRTIDYIETRKDLDATRIAYYGFSWGGALGAILPAMEPRLKVLVLEAGGLYAEHTLPEVDQINFASRIRIPVLMVNGSYDHFFPVETSQKPLLRLFGAAESDKRHVIVEGGHVLPRDVPEKEALEWLDRYQGRPQTNVR